jgi:hypothetical protein
MKNAPESAIVSSTARGIDFRGSRDSSAIEAAASNPTNRRIPIRRPSQIWFHEERDGGERRERQHRVDRQANADVVEHEDDRQRQQREQPPRPVGRAADVAGQELIGQDADADVDAAAAEEDGAEKEHAGSEGADGGVHAPGQVLVDRPRPDVLAGEQRQHVADAQHPERGDEHRQR